MSVSFNERQVRESFASGLRDQGVFEGRDPELPEPKCGKSSLVLVGRQITHLPDCTRLLQAFPNMEMVNLGGNRLAGVPRVFGRFQNLQHLHLPANYLTRLPREFATLSNLQTLNLADNLFTDVPPSVLALRSLTKLFLNGNFLNELPDGLSRLALKVLNISYNNFPALPAVCNMLQKKGCDVIQDSMQGDPMESDVLARAVRIMLTAQASEAGQQARDAGELSSASSPVRPVSRRPSEYNREDEVVEFTLAAGLDGPSRTVSRAASRAPSQFNSPIKPPSAAPDHLTASELALPRSVFVGTRSTWLPEEDFRAALAAAAGALHQAKRQRTESDDNNN